MDTLPDSPKSLWIDTYGQYTPGPVLQGDLKVDVAIISAEFTGLVTSYELKKAQPSLDIAVLEAKTVGYGASGRNGSFAVAVVGKYSIYSKGEKNGSQEDTNARW